MSSLDKIVAEHPLANKKPYNAIKFARVDDNGTPLYTVGSDKKALGGRPPHFGLRSSNSADTASTASNGCHPSQCRTTAREIICAQREMADEITCTTSSLPVDPATVRREAAI